MLRVLLVTAYETETKPALLALRKAARSGQFDALMTAVEAAANAGATRQEIIDSVGGFHAWNAFVKDVRKLTKEH